MIFVTLGTCPFQFERLVKLADKIADISGEDIFVQIGYTKLRPRNCRYKDFLDKDEYFHKIKEASIVLSHAGIGVSLDTLKMGKKLILVPRLRSLNEHTDNHQHELAKILVEQGRALLLRDEDDLGSLIEKAKNYNFINKNSAKARLVTKLSKHLKQIENNVN